MPYKNLEDRLASTRRWYARNREKRTKAMRDRRAMLRDWFRELKSTMKCARCPESEPVCLDFHHRDPTEKRQDICLMMQSGCSKENVLKEIAKCEVLCANCHRKEHKA